MIDAAQNADLINHSDEIASDYFEMQINSHKENWVEGIDTASCTRY